MPTLHIQISGGQKTDDGTILPVQPSVALLHRGPCVQASVYVADTIAKEIRERGEELPDPIHGHALIDTGASATCIDESAANELGVPATDRVKIASASHAQTEQAVYPISIQLSGLITIQVPRAISAQLSNQGLILLIGRDVLQHCTLFYNGPSGQLTISV